jgi:DNA invertase Pin-like site-specific DNA recombinase
MARKSRKNTDTAAVTAPAAKTWNVGAYVRLSVLDKKQKGDSIENQQAIIAAYCDEHPEFVIQEVYIDNGLSGQTFERPAFQKMLADMDAGLIDSCVAKDLSRYGRSAIDTGYYIDKYYPTRGIRCIAINDNYDSADGHANGVMVNLKNLVNENYALEVGRKIHATTQMNIRNGCFVGSIPPYGYMKSAEDKHKLVPDPITAPIVAKMFEMAANGQTARDIQLWLIEENVPPPLKHLYTVGTIPESRVQGGDHWNATRVREILKSRVYTGDMVQGKSTTQSYKFSHLEKSDWVITPNTHEPLVSRELFGNVQMNFATRGASRKPANNNVLRGKIVCGHCGYSMSLNGAVKKSRYYAYYTCSTRFAYAKDDCVSVSINEDKLKAALLEMLKDKAALYTLPPTAAVKPQQQSPSELASVSAELNRVNGFLKGLYESLVVGDITEPEYREMKQSYESKIAELTAREKALREASKEQRLQQNLVDSASAQLGSISTVSDLTAEVIGALIDKISVFEDKRFEVRFKFTNEICEGSAAK